MSDKPSDYDLTPEEPRPTPPQPAPTPLQPGAGSPPAGSQGAVPTGFVPPTPIILGPDDKDPEQVDAEENRVVAILGYIVFLLPLIFAPKSKFARYHANQALLVFGCGFSLMVLLMATWIGRNIIDSMPVLATVSSPVWYVTSCFCMPVNFLLIVGVMFLALQGIINAANGEKKPLPVVGKMNLIK